MRSTAKGQSLGWKCQYRGSALGAAADLHPMQMSNDFWPPPDRSWDRSCSVDWSSVYQENYIWNFFSQVGGQEKSLLP